MEEPERERKKWAKERWREAQEACKKFTDQLDLPDEKKQEYKAQCQLNAATATPEEYREIRVVVQEGTADRETQLRNLGAFLTLPPEVRKVALAQEQQKKAVPPTAREAKAKVPSAVETHGEGIQHAKSLLLSKGAASLPAVQKVLESHRVFCEREALKAHTPQLGQEFLEYCLTKVPARAKEEILRELGLSPAEFDRLQEQVIYCTRESAKARTKQWKEEYEADCLDQLPPKLRESAYFLLYGARRGALNAPPKVLPFQENGESETTLVKPLSGELEGSLGGALEADAADATEFHLLAYPPRRPGDVVSTRSTSLTIPEGVKLHFQEEFGEKTPLYYKAIGIYERVFAEGVKASCKKVQGFLDCQTLTAPEFAAYLGDPYEEWEKYSRLRRGKTPGVGYKLWDSTYYTLFNTIKGTGHFLNKITSFTNLLGEFRNQYAVGSYLLTGHLPYSFKWQISKAWGVTPAWVRNTTFGWRRKLDAQAAFQKSFPAFQINQVVSQTQGLKDELQMVLKGSQVTKSMLQVLNLLQKYQLLHLLLWDQAFPQIPGLLTGELHAAAEQLRTTMCARLTGAQRTALVAKVYPTPLHITESEFQASAEAIMRGVGVTLERIQQELDTARANLARMQGDSPEKNELESEVKQNQFRYTRLKRFQNHCKLLNDDRRKFAYLFQLILPASRQLRSLASIIASVLPRWGGRKRRVLAALGAILSRACLLKFAGEPAKVVATLQPLLAPQVLLTAPFCGKDRRKQLQPLELPAAFAKQQFPPLYVQEPTTLREQLDLDKAPADRRPPKQIVTETRARAQGLPPVRPGLIFLLPKSQVKAAWEIVRTAQKVIPKTGAKCAVVPSELAENAVFTQYFTRALPMKARFTIDMVTFLQQGAHLSPPRVLPPRGPNHKLIVNLLFHGEAKAFQKAPKFYDMTYYRKKGTTSGRTVTVTPPHPLEKGRLLGLDINRISTKDIVKFATPSEKVESDAEGVQVHLLRDRMSKMRNDPKYKTPGKKKPKSQFGRVWKAIAEGEKHKSPKLGRLRMERTLLYQRWSNLKKALDREVSLAGARVLITQGAEVLAVEELGLDPRGKAGRLGAIITDMPKRAAITAAMVAKANQHHMINNKWRPPVAMPDQVPVVLEPVSPFWTSQLCPDCGGKLVGTQDYDIVYCPQCRKYFNRHESAARVVAQRGQRKWQRRAAHGLL